MRFLVLIAFFALAMVATTSALAQPRLTKAPELIEQVEADYPKEALAAGRSATVILQIAISATGTVEQVAVIGSGGAEFDVAAIEAVKKFVFRPAEINHKPAPVKITYRYQFTPKVVAPTTGSFRGVVIAKGTNAPLANITIDVEGVGKAVTNERGEFAFTDIPPGEITVRVSGKDITELQTKETIDVGRTLEAKYAIELPVAPGAAAQEKDDFEVVVVAPKLVKQVVSTEVSADEARRVPGTQGDVLKVVENLPGVARATAGSGQVVVWGAAPQDTRTYVGAVRVPMLYHFGGLRSVLHNDRVASVELVPGGYGAAYGRGLGGLVRVTQRDIPNDKLHGSAQLDLLDGSLAVSTPIAKNLRVAISGRRSHIAEASRVLEDQSFEEFFTLPKYFDGQARIRYDLAANEWIEVGGLLSGDRQARTQPSNDPARRVTDTRTLYFQRYDFVYHRQLKDGSEVDLSPWYGRDQSGRFGNFGGVPTSLETESHLAGLRSEWRGRFLKNATARVGFDFELVQSTTTRNGSITSPPREGDAYVFGRPPSDQVSADVWKTTIASAAPYGEVDWSLFGERVHITPGLRFEPFFLNVNRRKPHDPNAPDLGLFQQDIAIQPRLAARYSPITSLTYKGAIGLYRQPPLPDDLSALFGNPNLGISKGTHYVAGATFRAAAVSIETNLFHTTSEALVARNASSSPRLGEALLQQGEGRSTGVQFLVRRDKGTGRFFGWIAYTILRSERKDGPDSRWRLFDYDQTHVLTALGSYDLGRGFEIGVRARVASGFPRTPLRYVYYDARRNRYEPTLGEYNTDRIPFFMQFDIRAAKRFQINTSDLEVYLDIQNVMNRANPEEIAYSLDFSQRRYILGLPILPILGARWSF